MKLKAIRAENIGVLQAATALEGLSGGLDVIAAPNEAGKSTLLRAVVTALSEDFATKKQTLKDLKSADGGAPVIEIDFEIAGSQWRLTKRYLSKAEARLVSLSSGKRFDNADAEGQIKLLLGHDFGKDGVRPLLWVEQTTSIDRAQPTSLAAGTFKAQLTAEIAGATGSSLADAVRARVKSRMAELLTATGRTKTGGDLDLASKAADAAAKAHQAAVALATEVAARRARLSEVSAAEAALADPAAAIRRAARIEAAQRAMADADKAETARTAAEAAFRAAEQGLVRAKQEHDRLRERLARLDAANMRVARVTPELAILGQALATATALHAAARRSLAAAQHCEYERRRARIQARLAAVDVALAKAATAAAGAASNAIDPRVIEAARTATRALETLDAELAASAATVDLALTAEGRAKVRINGAAPAPGGTPVLADQPVVIEIAGIGTITVTPGGGSARALQLTRRTELSTELATLLGKCHVTSLTEAAARLAAVEAHRRTQHDAEVELAAALAGDTRAGLEAELTRLDAAARRGGEDEGAASTELTLEQAEADHFAAARALEAVRIRHHTAARDLDAAAAESRVLAAEAPTPDTRTIELDRSSAAVASADLLVRSAAVELGAWRARVLSHEAAERLRMEMAAATTAAREAEGKMSRMRSEIAEINGRLMEHERAAGAETRSDLAELAGEADRAARALARVEDEKAVLVLLEQEFAAAEAEDQKSFVTPIMKRLTPHLSRLFAGAAVGLDTELGVTTLARGQRTFDFDRLSTGTREQVSVLVRLAFAELLADRGQSLPVILDDALVYCDDDRREHMFATLARAAERHQVIILTCQQSFAESLVARHGAVAHAMRPWQDRALVSAA